MLRDMKKARVTYILCALIVAIGFCGYSVLELCYENLQKSKTTFIEDSDFCDGFAEVESAPRSESRILSEVEGIETVEGRLVENVRLTGLEGEAELNIVSWEEGGMNRPVLSKGSLPQKGSREIVIGEGISGARNIEPGDTLRLLIGGKQVEVTVSGVGLTPENIYMIKDISEMYPDPAGYDAAFMSYETMADLFSMDGQVNSFLFKLKTGTEWKKVKEPIERILESYGCQTAYAKEDQLSINMVDEEIAQLKRMSTAVPFLFLAVAGVILYITLSRLVEQQRTQIGTLMALGLPLGKIKFHYMYYGAFTGFVGGLLGGIGGYAASGPMADYYRMYFNLPKVTTPVSYTYFAGGILAAVLFCGGTAWLIAGGVGKMTPAGALRPAAPKNARISFLERIPGFVKLFTVPGLLALRNLARNRKRTVLSLSGMAFAYMITATLVSLNSMFDIFIFDYWEITQRQDMMVQFSSPVIDTDAFAAVEDPEVGRTEGVMEFSASLYGPEGKTDCSIQAIAPDSDLCRLFDEEGTRVFPEESGIILSRHMSDLMGIKSGDLVEIKVSYPKEKISRVPVTAVIAQYMGNTAYMSYEGAGRISEYRNVYNSILLKAPAGVQEVLIHRLEDASAVSLIENRQARLGKLRSMMGSMSAMMGAMSMMGVIIGVAVIYVSSLISFEELKREVSTLMMLGLKSGQCLDVISTGQWILAAGGVMVGIPMSMGVSRLISATMSSDLYSIPSLISATALLQAIGLMALSVGFSSLLMLRKLKKMSPSELLRDRE